MTQVLRKKALEEIYVRSYLSVASREATPTPSEEPDFLLHEGSQVVGLEVRRIFRDESGSGSGAKQGEVLRAKALIRLARAFYSAGGATTLCRGTAPPLDGEALASAARELAALRSNMVEWERRKVALDSAGPRFWLEVEALPSVLGEYISWQVAENYMAWVRKLETSVLEAAISEKAQRLVDYRKTGLQHIELLLVADGTQASGMFHFDPADAPAPDSQGFAAVHLLLYPGKVYQVASAAL